MADTVVKTREANELELIALFTQAHAVAGMSRVQQECVGEVAERFVDVVRSAGIKVLIPDNVSIGLHIGEVK
ncbi:MAG: hypothetical protein LRY76_05975 [Alphaproteobacteria bacterium]|nr:hypothetical protein [Alphaproteobacteria bacterium]